VLCPYCRTENALGATRCAACTSWMTRPPPAREWTRAREGRWLGGVAQGLANRFGFSTVAIRLAFVLATVLVGWGAVVYLALWVLMPLEPLALPASTREPVAAEGPRPPPPV
jgi:phage shock protein PspC (stress-responsive transcriptional regulator)